jgi:hypothetical protein
MARAASQQTIAEVLRGAFDRVEVYRPDGSCGKVVAAPRKNGRRSGPDAASVAADIRRDLAGSPAPPARSSMTLAQALRTARDPNATLEERQEAIAVLGRSGSSEVLGALRSLALQDPSGLGRAALAALGGFGGTAAAAEALAVLNDLTAQGAAAGLDRFRALAALDGSGQLISEFQNTNNTLERKNMVHMVAQSTQQAADASKVLTDFLIAALGDRSETVRAVAALEAATNIGSEDVNRILPLLEAAANNDRSPMVRDAAGTSAGYVKAGGIPSPDRQRGSDSNACVVGINC